MSEKLTIAEAQAQLPELPARLARAPIVVMQDDQPAIVMLNPDEFASLLETLEILSDRALMASIREGIAQAEAGQTVSLETVRAQLGL
ncbi:type II toxin-antitoxin system Phd/YefM family antitoxin [Trichothermofontia sp.]